MTTEVRNKAGFLERSRYFMDALGDFGDYYFMTPATLTDLIQIQISCAGSKHPFCGAV